MRAEVKVGLIVGLVAIAGGAIWWFSRTSNELDELPFDRPAMDITSPDDTALAADAVPVSPGSRSQGPEAPARRERLQPTPRSELAADQPGTRAEGPPRMGEPASGTPSEPLVLPGDERSPGAAQADQPETRAREGSDRTEPVDSPPSGATLPPRPATRTELRPPPRKTYVIQPGDRLIDLARDEYGDGDLWEAIKAVNPDLDENRLQIGQEIQIPSRAEALRLAQVTAEPARPAPRPRADEPQAGRATYVVGRGDTLIKIARNVLNDETRWDEIYELNRNRLESPHLLRVGMELRLPPLEKKATEKETEKE